jgi:hypothetical protein
MIRIPGLRYFPSSDTVGFSASRKKSRMPCERDVSSGGSSWVSFGLPLSTVLPETLEQHRAGIRMDKVLQQKLRLSSSCEYK